MNIVETILENKQSVRKIIDEAVKVQETDAAIDTSDVEDTAVAPQQNGNDALLPADSETYKQLFVRRFNDTASDKPSKRSKVFSANEALTLYFSWLKKYPNEKVEIWSSNGQDVTNFYDYCKTNAEQIQPLWQKLFIFRKGLKWVNAYKEIKLRAGKSGSQFIGTLDPFVQEAK